MSDYVLVGRVRSSTDGRRFWLVKRNEATGTLTCNCPNFIYQHGSINHRKPCKHIVQLSEWTNHKGGFNE
jgi:hypothetical protein